MPLAAVSPGRTLYHLEPALVLLILFSLVGSIIYVYTGTQYNTAPAFGSLGN